MSTLNYIDENGNINKAGVIPKNYPASNISYGEGTVKSKLDSLTTDVSGKVSKSGDTISGTLTVDRADGTSSAVGYSLINVGNMISSGTEKNSQGLIDVFGTTQYRSRIKAGALTAHREVSLPNKSGTLATTDDIHISEGQLSESSCFRVIHNMANHTLYIKPTAGSNIEQIFFIVLAVANTASPRIIILRTVNNTAGTAIGNVHTTYISGSGNDCTASGDEVIVPHPEWAHALILSDSKFTTRTA